MATLNVGVHGDAIACITVEDNNDKTGGNKSPVSSIDSAETGNAVRNKSLSFKHVSSKQISVGEKPEVIEIELEDIPGTESAGVELNKRGSSITESGDAVVIRNAEKSYNSGHPILKGLNLTVPCGSIYGLLGSSGCGKTTVLSCIVGLRRLDRGTIWVFGENQSEGRGKLVGVPGRNVGYQPQELSLYTEFSIAETLNYFGTLSGMTKTEIENARSYLVALLDLPEDTRRIGTLSGGQQRRVSLVSALLSGPELLILDEPTVGVDPLVRQNIWLHLKKLVGSKRTTVIITTHYIEECRTADNIGVMRNGRLLVERPPQDLMADHGSTNLERIVLDLSRKDKQKPKLSPTSKKQRNAIEDSALNVQKDTELPAHMATVLHKPDTGLKDSLVRIKALTEKNFVILYRNPLLLFFVLLNAAFLVMLCCMALGQDPKNLPVGLINNEVKYSDCSNRTRVVGECNVDILSCRYLTHLTKGVLNLELFENETDALRAVKLGSSWGYITFPNDFSTSFYERLASGAIEDEETLKASEILVKLDVTNKQISNTIKKELYDAFDNFTSTMLYDCGFDPRQAESSLKYGNPIFGEDSTDFREFLAPGTTMCVLFFFPIITTSIRYIKEKKNGVLHRSVVGGVQTWEIMMAYSVSEFCVLVAQVLLNYAVISIIYQIEILGSHVLVMIIFLLSGYGGVAIGFLIGSICTEEIQAAMLAMAAFFPNILLSGIIWPPEGMVEAMQYFIKFLPCTFAAEAARSITSRGWGFLHRNVWPGYAVLVGYIVGYFILTVLFNVLLRR